MVAWLNKRKLYSLRKFLLRLTCRMGISYRVYPYGFSYRGIHHWLFRYPNDCVVLPWVRLYLGRASLQKAALDTEINIVRLYGKFFVKEQT